MGPESDFKDTDLVTNRRALQMLFQFASGNPVQDFRIDLHMVHNTLFLTRKEQRTYFVVNACGTSKVGSNFESAFTTPEPGLEDSSSHHRVLRYTLGDLKCVVRFEADACCKEKQNDPQALDQRCVNLFSSLSEKKVRAKCKQLFSTESEAAAVAEGNISARTSVVLGGRIVPSSTMAELKTSQSANFGVAKHLPQLWFGRTSNLLIGTHTDGTFHKLEAIDLAKQLLEWEKTHQEKLRKLTWLIAELRKTVRSTPGGYCILVGKGKARKATVYAAAKRTSVLPANIVEQFWRWREAKYIPGLVQLSHKIADERSPAQPNPISKTFSTRLKKKIIPFLPRLVATKLYIGEPEWSNRMSTGRELSASKRFSARSTILKVFWEKLGGCS